MRKKQNLQIVGQAKRDAHEAVKKVGNEINRALQGFKTAKNVSDKTYEITPLRFTPISRSMQTPENNFNLFYSKTDKVLTRYIGKKALTYKFSRGKRLPLFEELLFVDQYTSTETLKNKLSCPTVNAIYKLVEGINTQIKNTLSLDNKLIEGREGFGYRINKKFKIHKE